MIHERGSTKIRHFNPLISFIWTQDNGQMKESILGKIRRGVRARFSRALVMYG